MKGDDYLLVNEAAALLGVAPNTIRAWSGAGKLAEYRHPVNNYRLFKKIDVERLRDQILNPDAQPRAARRRRSAK